MQKAPCHSPTDNPLIRHARLRARLDEAVRPRGAIHVVVNVCEINERHGSGPLLRRIFAGRTNIFSIRSRNRWGTHQFGDWNACIPQLSADRADWRANVLEMLAGREIASVTCVPFYADEIRTSLAIQEEFGAKIAAYIMDDQNVSVSGIADELMREFLQNCLVRFATHPEMRAAYERKYGLRFFLLPAVVPDVLIRRDEDMPGFVAKRAALIGSIWDQVWFDGLCDSLDGLGWKIDWFGNHQSPWLDFSRRKMERAGIAARGVIPEARLAAELRSYPFAIVPAGTLDGRETNAGVAALSLPGRILFAMATSHTPVLVVGNERTCAARFVKHFGIGESVPYDRRAMERAMNRLTDAEAQKIMRRRAREIGPRVSDRGVSEWFQKSVELGRAADPRFEDAFAGYGEA